jgi:uncharacterized protein (TIGR03382 family)
VSPTEVGEIGVDVAPGKQAVLEIGVLAPVVTENTPVMTQFALATNGMMFGTIDLAATVTIDGDEDMSGEADDTGDGGGCSTTNGCGSLVILAALALLRRRRRQGAIAVRAT